MTTVPIVITETKDKPDELAGFLSKFILGYFVGPKVSAMLVSIGVSIDPALASIALAGLIHKIHVMVAAKLKKS